MSILQRFSDIMRSNINALLDKCEDPAKMVDQYLIDARRDLAECKAQTASVMAAEKAAARALDECSKNVNQYTDAARKAVEQGNDDDARALIQSKQRYEAQLPQLQKNYDAAHDSAEKMRQLYSKLTADIQTLEARKNTVKSTVAVAKAQETVNQVGAKSEYGSTASSGMARMEAKAAERLDRAMAEADLDADIRATDDLAAKYASGGSASVEDELAAIKASMNQ